MSLWAVKTSRSLPLHTYDREERAYTSTPTKIGGHCLDHVRNGLDLWSGSDRPTPPSNEFEKDTTQLLLPTGRFGGLSPCAGDVILRFGRRSQRRPALHRRAHTHSMNKVLPAEPRPRAGSCAMFPMYVAPVELPPDSLAWRHIPGAHSEGERVMMHLQEEHGSSPSPSFQQQEQLDRQDRQPQQRHGNYYSSRSGRNSGDHGGVATKHAGALMAVLLSKLANGNGVSNTSVVYGEEKTDAIVLGPESLAAEDLLAGGSINGGAESGIPALCERSPLTSSAAAAAAAGDGATPTADPSWQWKSRLRQATSYSKLRRFSFVRELGRGSHGIILLVKKVPSGELRVLKESSFLSEAVNEARLLLLAGAGKNNAEGETSGDGDGGAAWLLQHSGGLVAKEDGDERIHGKKGQRVDDPGVVGAAAGERPEQRGGVIKLHDFFVETLGHTPLAFLELEFCGGGDLHDLILASERDDHVGGEIHGDRLLKPAIFGGGQARDKRGTGVPADQIARVILGLCEGLQCLHERGVLHRDLKPGNVLLTKSGAVRIADLGVSTSLEPSRPLTEHAAGTIPFIAPEVRKFLLGAKVHYSGKADVWAVGALMYAMAVGDPAPAELSTTRRAELASVVGHRTGSEALSLIAHKTLDPDPAKRPSVHQVS
ncbi:unnamed protein product, partial [Sphacelaria rigidula]